MNNRTDKLVLCFTAFYLPGFKGGGPIKTISNAVYILGDKFRFFVFTLDRDLGDSISYTSVTADKFQRVNKAIVFYTSPCLIFINIIYLLFKKNWDFIHLNSFFSFGFSILPLFLSKVLKPNIPIILGPRGEFSIGALSLHNKRKFIYIKLFKFLGLHNNITFHASTHYEKLDIQRLFGNDVKLKIAIDLPSPVEHLKILERPIESPFKIIFLSRISPMKNLVGAFEILKFVKSPIEFHVYGPVEDVKYYEYCKYIASLSPVNVKPFFHGFLNPNLVQQTLSVYDLFLLPSLGENYCHVIAEALSAGLPVLISDQTPWKDLESKRLGTDLPLNDLPAFANFIDKCSNMDPKDYLVWRTFIRNWSMVSLISKQSIEENASLYTN